MGCEGNVLQDCLQWDLGPEEILTEEDLIFLGNYPKENDEEDEENEFIDPNMEL